MTRIYFNKLCAWFAGGYSPNEGERKLLAAFTEGLPNPPVILRIDGRDLMLRSGYQDGGLSWVEYEPISRKEGEIKPRDES